MNLKISDCQNPKAETPCEKGGKGEQDKKKKEQFDVHSGALFLQQWMAAQHPRILLCAT